MLATLLDQGWDYHDKESARLAGELEEAASQPIEPGLHTRFLQLSNHTIGEHLSDWRRARALAERVLATAQPTPESARAWSALYVARFVGGDPAGAAAAELICLEAAGAALAPALINMRFMLASALVGSQRSAEAAPLYRGALALAHTLDDASSLDRAIAVTSNNLAWELYDKPVRNADEDALMALAAKSSLEFWLKCGNWVNEELGLHLNSLVATALGNARAGLAHADAGLAVIAANSPRPYDEAMLHLARWRALDNGEAKGRALRDADAAAARLSDAELKSQFAAERAKAGA